MHPLLFLGEGLHIVYVDEHEKAFKGTYGMALEPVAQVEDGDIVDDIKLDYALGIPTQAEPRHRGWVVRQPGLSPVALWSVGNVPGILVYLSKYRQLETGQCMFRLLQFIKTKQDYAEVLRSSVVDESVVFGPGTTLSFTGQDRAVWTLTQDVGHARLSVLSWQAPFTLVALPLETVDIYENKEGVVIDF